MTDPVFRTKTFVVTVGPSPFVRLGHDLLQPLMYIITNVDTGVVEAESRMLAQTIDWCRGMEKTLADASGQPTTLSVLDAVNAIPDATLPAH